MKRLTGLVLGVAAAALVGCGDSSVECGPGTAKDDDGYCVPDGENPPNCGDGTKLDPETNTCVIDESACQNGTVLIDNKCVDPTEGLTADVTEAAEPNALGFFGEPSDDPAGTFELKAVGGAAVVLQGNLNPQADRDDDGELEADYDTYLFEAQGPTLLEISVDGVGGAAGGFAIVNGDSDAMASWIRVGANQLGDTAKRQVFLPQGGVYVFIVADTRSFLQGAAVGDADNKYWVSIKQLAVPTATTLTVTDGVARALDNLPAGEVKLYSTPFGAGFNSVSYFTENTNDNGSVVVATNGGVRAIADEDGATASALIAGVNPTDTNLIVADQVINVNQSPTAFDLQVIAGDATPLSTTGGMANAINPTDGDAGDYPASIDGMHAFYFDVNSANQTLGIDLSWNTDVDSVLLDSTGTVVSNFTFDPSRIFLSFFDGTGWFSYENYKGLFRAPAAGRYYLLTWDPYGALGAELIATSTITPLTPATLTAGTPITGVAPNAFNSNPYTFNADNQVWDLFTATADATAGGARVSYYAPASAYGVLDTLVRSTIASTPTTTNYTQVTPSFSATSTAQQGFILLNGPATLYAKVNTTAGAGTFGIDAATRTFSDEGTHPGPYTVTHTAQDFPVTGPRGAEHYYLLRTDPGSSVTVTVTPSTAAANLAMYTLNPNETTLTTRNLTTTGAETQTYTIGATGYIALSVRDTATTTDTFDIEWTVTAPVVAPSPYTVAVGSTAWQNACVGGSDVTPLTRDDDFTNAIMLPTGFDFFGNTVTAIKISTNGWFTFDSTADISAAASRAEQLLPSATAPNNLVAAYWDDLDGTRICTKTVGTKFIVQWRGVLYGTTTTVAAQAILDTADDTVEIVHAPYTLGTGSSASSGIEGPGGTAGLSLFYRSATGVEAGTSKKLTPIP